MSRADNATWSVARRQFATVGNTQRRLLTHAERRSLMNRELPNLSSSHSALSLHSNSPWHSLSLSHSFCPGPARSFTYSKLRGGLKPSPKFYMSPKYTRQGLRQGESPPTKTPKKRRVLSFLWSSSWSSSSSLVVSRGV